MEAVVRMERHEGGWRVEIRETSPHQPGSRAFAAVEAYDIDTALKMAAPYFACLAEPDPFSDMVAQAERRVARAVRRGRVEPD